MKLDPERLVGFVTGAPYAETASGVLTCHRMPLKMRAIHMADEGSRIRMECPAGVRLRFRTDSRHVGISLRYGEPARWYLAGGIVIDGKTCSAFGPIDRVVDWSGAAFIQPENKMVELDLWLAHLCPAQLAGLELDDGSALEPAGPLPVRWLVYGDSISHGMTATLPVFTWTSRCARTLNAEIVNLAVGGAILDERLADCPVEGRFDIVTVLYGANDRNCNVPMDAFGRNADLLLASLEKTHEGTPVLLITPLVFMAEDAPNGVGAMLADYRKCLEDLSGKYGNVRLVRGPDLVPNNQNFFADKSHPNDSGSAVIARNLLPVMKEVLGSIQNS